MDAAMNREQVRMSVTERKNFYGRFEKNKRYRLEGSPRYRFPGVYTVHFSHSTAPLYIYDPLVGWFGSISKNKHLAWAVPFAKPINVDVQWCGNEELDGIHCCGGYAEYCAKKVTGWGGY